MGWHLDSRRQLLTLMGRGYTLRRLTATTPTYSSVTVQGFRRDYRPDEIVGDLVQGDWMLEILNDEISSNSWAGPPRHGDEVLDGTALYAVQGAEAIYEGADLIGWCLRLRGGQ